MVKVKIHIFVNWKPTKRKEIKEQKEKTSELTHFIRHIKAFCLYISFMELGQFLKLF